MRRIKLFSLIQERVARRMCPSRWSARRRASWSAGGESAAAELLEPRCLLVAGDLDPSFGTGGKVSTSFGFDAIGRSAAIQSDGKIIVAGDNNSAFILARYNNDGSLEGVVTTDFGTSEGYAIGVAVQTDGKAVVAGTIYNGTNFDFAVARYNIDGSLDTSFDGDGMLTTDFAGLNDRATALAIQPNGRIIVVGKADSVGDAFGDNTDFALVRYNSNGSLDTSFDGDGRVTTDFPAFGELSIDFAYSVALQSDNKIVVFGDTIHVGLNDYIFALARYNSDGTLDTTFNHTGKLTVALGSNGTASDHAASVAVQVDGKIVVAGSSLNGSTNDVLIARFNKNGSLDTSFGSGGTALNGFGTSNDVAASMALQTDGKIVVAGYSDYFGDNDFELMRFNSNGSLDTSFDGNGALLADFGNSDDYAGSVVIQPNGRIVAAGYTTLNGNSNFALARFDDASVSRLSIVATNSLKPEGQSGSTPLTFTVNRTGDTGGRSSVQYSVTGSGTNPADASDFGGILPSGMVAFASGELSRTITVSVRGDTSVENEESFTVTLSNAANANILTATDTGTILNDDASLAIAGTDAKQNEGDSGNTPFTFTVTRAGDASRTASVKYTVKGSGAAANATDFGGVAFPSGTLNFAVDETAKTISLNVRGDTTIESDEGFMVTLSNPVNAILATATATGTILNDDASVSITPANANKNEGSSGTTPFTFTVTRTGNARGSASVDFVVAGAATKGASAADFDGGTLPAGSVTFAANETTKTIAVNVSSDTTVEPNEGFIVTLLNPAQTVVGISSAAGTILNDDTSLAIVATSANKVEGKSGNTPFTFTITRAGDVHSTASVQFATSGSDVNPADAADFGGSLPSGVVNFTAKQTSKTITVNVRGDIAVEPDDGFTVTLSNATNAQIATATATGAIKNDDTMLSLSPSNISQTEGDSGETTFTFMVTRTGNLSRTASVKFIVAATGTPPANVADFGGTFPSGTLSFAVNETTKTITINVRGDSAVESDEGFKLTLSNPVNAMLDALAILATGTIQNDD